MKKWNHYTCEECGKVTIARHDDEGVTPFIIGCYASDEIRGKHRIKICKGSAQSCFFDCDQSDKQKPHIIFYRPKDAITAIEAIKKEHPKEREWLLEHYMKGGSLMKVC